MRSIGIGLLVLLCLHAGYCFSGTVHGYIRDKTTGEPIDGATVTIDDSGISAVTGLDGGYHLRNINSGDHDLHVNALSFQPFTQHIRLSDTSNLAIDISLLARTSTLGEVEVKSTHLNAREEQALNLEHTSDNIRNVMSARTIELLPDISVANVLQRVSGVTVQRDNNGEARYAIIRGMDKRYSYATIDGIKIPSPDDKMRYVPMDIFPAEIVERIEVVKTLTPDMEGDAIGGIVNLKMKDAPDDAVLNTSINTGYSETLTGRGFPGFPKSAISLKDPTQLNGTNYQAASSDFQRQTANPTNIHAPINGSFSLTAGKRFLKNKKLGLIFSGIYQNAFEASDNIFLVPAIQPGENNTPVITDVQIRRYSTQEQRKSAYAKFDYRFNDINALSLSATYLQLDELQTRDMTDTSVQVGRAGAGTGQVDYFTRAAFRRQNIANIALSGKHSALKKLRIDYTLAWSVATRAVPDMTELNTTTTAYLDSSHHSLTTPLYLTSLTHSWEHTSDKNISGFLNVGYSAVLMGKEVSFTAGGMASIKKRTNYYNDYLLQPLFANQLFDNIYDAAMTVQRPQGDLNNDLNYCITENIEAGYAQARLAIHQLTILTGLRIEHTHEEYAMNVDPNLVAGQHAVFNYTDLLPGIHFRYRLNDKAGLRLSYFESISRPGFFELVPYHNIGEYYTETGNDSLNHTRAGNFDLRYEWLPGGLDELSVGGFYKRITDPIEYLLAPQPGKALKGELMPVNVTGKPAQNFGAEIVAAKYFHAFGISANYTYTNSSITTTRLSRLRDSAGSLHNYTVMESRPLQGQSAHVANLALIYKSPARGLDAHLTWVYTGRQIVFLSGFEGLDYWQRATSFFDFSCEKKLRKHLFAYAKVNNLLNTPVIVELQQSKDMFVTGNYQLPYQTLSDNTLIAKSTYGRNYLVGIRYKLAE